MSAGEGPVSCSVCGTTEREPPLTWMSQTEPQRGQVWVCQDCARRHLRSIEARLEQEWW